MSTFQKLRSRMHSDDGSRVSLASLLHEEMVRGFLPVEDQEKERPRIPRPETEEELAAFFLKYLGLTFPNKAVCPGHSHPWAAICDAFFARYPVVVWKASRGYGGKTFTMGALAFAEAVTLRASVTLLGGSSQQSARVLSYLSEFWNKPKAPRWALASDPTAYRANMVWGNQVTALMASLKSVSGPHPQRLRIDEVDLVDLPLLDQALGQPMSRDGVTANVVLSSAHYEPDGTLTEVIKRARANGHPVHEWCWRETTAPYGWTDPADVERQRQTVTKLMWSVQYDLQEPTAEGRAIDPSKVERMFLGASIPSPVLDEFPYREFERPIEGASYATGADWARTSDFVEMITLRDDVFPLRLVAYQRFRKRPVQYIQQQFDYQTLRYPGTSAHDATSFGGQVMNDLIAQDGQTAPEGVIMTGGRRKFLFTNYVVAIEREELISPRIEPLYRQHKFCRNDDLFGTGHPPDGMVAGAMAYHASAAGTTQLRMVTGTPVIRQVGPMTKLQGFAKAMALLGSGTHACQNPLCDRACPHSVAYCCQGCALADEGHYEIHPDGLLGHSAVCNERHPPPAEVIDLPPTDGFTLRPR